MWNNLDIDKLTETELAGMGTANPVIDWIRGFGVMSEFLSLSPNSRGSVSLDFDFATVAGRILALMEHTYGEFHGTIRGSDRLEVAGGHIYVGKLPFEVPAYTRSLESGDSGKCMKVTIAKDGGSWQATTSWGVVPPVAVTDSHMVMPICGAVKSGSTWHAYQYRLGSVVIPFPPACMIDGYDKGEQQSLDHKKGVLQWTTYKKCGSNN